MIDDTNTFVASFISNILTSLFIFVNIFTPWYVDGWLFQLFETRWCPDQPSDQLRSGLKQNKVISQVVTMQHGYIWQSRYKNVYKTRCSIYGPSWILIPPAHPNAICQKRTTDIDAMCDIPLAALRIAYFCTYTSKTFCLNCVKIVRLGFRLEMCTCWVLTRVYFILASSHYHSVTQIIIEYSLLWTRFCKHKTSGRPFVLRKHLIVTSTSTKRLLETTWEVARCWSCLTIHRISI